MIPVCDIIPRRTTPLVTLVAIGLGGAALAAAMLLPVDDLRALVYAYGLVPADVSWFSPFTAALLHHGPIDGASNLLALWIFAPAVEDRLGRGRFAAFVVATTLAASAVAVLSRAGSPLPVIGAAGVTAAAITAHLSLFPKSRTLVLVPGWRGLDAVEVPTVVLAGFWFLLQVIGSRAGLARAVLTGGLPIFAMLGGTLSGLLLVHLLRRRDREAPAWWDTFS